MQGCLLDNNHVSAFFNEEPKVIEAINSMPAERGVWVCAITLGEIEAGHEITQTTDQQRRDEYKQFVKEAFIFHKLDVSEFTGFYYGQIVGRIFAKHPPKDDTVKTEHWLVSLDVDVNDVWAVAVAWEQ